MFQGLTYASLNTDLNDTEIWRTSTAEPTAHGIIWTYVKDVSNYVPLWKQQQSVIFDLGNIVNSIYTGSFDTTLTATFFTEQSTPAAADIIYPISAQQSSAELGSAWSVPQQNASSTLKIPQNVKRAVFSVSACGQIDEEFWWSNVLSSDTQTFPNNTLLGYSTFREIQLLIDGQLAGVAWPFPVIFTGGVVPGFWRPIVGIDAFDLKEDEIDVTPWLPVLSDGQEHTYEIRVVGITDDGNGNGILTTVGSYWVVSGKLFLWLDEADSITTGSTVIKNDPDPSFFLASHVETASNGTNLTLGYQVLAQRQLSFSSTITTSNGSQQAAWSQTLSFSNIGNLTNGGLTQINTQMTNGVNVASSGFSTRFAYPLLVWSTVSITNSGNDIAIVATMDRGKNAQVVGPSAFPTGAESFESNTTYNGASYGTRQNGSANYVALASSNTSQSWGTTEQDFTLSGLLAGGPSYPNFPPVGPIQQLYSRHVLAVNATVIQDSNPSSSSEGYIGGHAPQLGSGDYGSNQNFVAPPEGSVIFGRHPHIQKRNALYRRGASFGNFH